MNELPSARRLRPCATSVAFVGKSFSLLPAAWRPIGVSVSRPDGSLVHPATYLPQMPLSVPPPFLLLPIILANHFNLIVILSTSLSLCYCRFCHSLFTRFLLRLRLGRGVEGNARVSEQTTGERHTAPSPWHHTYVSTSAGAGASCKPTTSFSPLFAFALRAASPSLCASPVARRCYSSTWRGQWTDGRRDSDEEGRAGGQATGRAAGRPRPATMILPTAIATGRRRGRRRREEGKK